MAISCSYSIKAMNKEIESQIATMESNVKSYADKMDFLNLRLIIGTEGEKHVNITFSGLTATIHSTLIFLGGYCSTLPTTNITLTPNATNFIYIDRDASDRNLFHVSARTTLRGAEGQSSFNYFNAAKAVTSSTAVTSSKIYNVVV